jgi:para-nitrobenzyl esterase
LGKEGALEELDNDTVGTSLAAERRRSTVVETAHGKLRGLIQDGVVAFKGVPYGQSTAGRNRFLPPQPLESWAGVRNATRLGHPCLQTNPDFPVWSDPMPGSEDCLVLNVWAPEQAWQASKLPVMVWIHGGGYTFGSAGAPLYDLGNLARTGNVVAVGINHRLQAFGFTDLSGDGGGDFAASGNAGILDIIAALRWVRDNIGQFGGDPKNVTVFGQSGGGAKISTLMGMPEAQGLFHKAVIQSGSVFRYRNPDEAEAMSNRMFSLLGISRNDIVALQAVPAPTLLACGDRIMNEAQGTGHPSLKYAPVIDGRHLPTRPWNTAAPAGSHNIPLLLGTTRDETIIYLPDEARNRKPLGNDEAIAKAVVASVSSYTPDQARAADTIPFYRKQMGQVSDMELVLQMSTDLAYWKDMVRQAELQTDAGMPVFAYRCDWRTPCYGAKWAPHSIELPFIMGHRHYGSAWDGQDTDAQRAAADPDNARFRVGDQMLAAWTSFARHGNPSTSDLAWPKYDLNKRSTMIFDRETKVVEDPHGEFRPVI